MSRGQGSIYKYKNSKNWHICYWRNGVRYHESSGSDKYHIAQDLLKERNSQMFRGIPINPTMARIQVNELLDRLIEEYKANERRSVKDLEGRIRLHLKPFFVGFKAAKISSDLIVHYVNYRKNQNAENATINRELAALSRAFHLGSKADIVSRVPSIPRLKENNVRQGFVTDEQFEEIVKHLPEQIRPVVRMAYITGWRTRSEIVPLQWKQIDFKRGTVRLEPGTTKNREGREIFMTGALRRVLEAQREVTDLLQKELGCVITWVFHRNGEPIKEFRSAWTSACKKAGRPGVLVHDLRRSATRNFEKSGLSRGVAMKITGHLTESIYRRYAIVSEIDMKEAAEILSKIENR
jgi:integrase